MSLSNNTFSVTKGVGNWSRMKTLIFISFIIFGNNLCGNLKKKLKINNFTFWRHLLLLVDSIDASKVHQNQYHYKSRDFKITPRIINGFPTTVAQFPYQLSLRVDNAYRCGLWLFKIQKRNRFSYKNILITQVPHW